MNLLSIPKNIPDKHSLENRFKIYNLLNYVILIVFIVVDIFLIWEIFYSIKDLNTRGLGVIGLTITFVILFLLLYLPIIRKVKVELKFSENKHIGNYSKDELIDLFHELLKPYKIKELPKIYIIKDKTPVVSVVNSFFMNFIKQLNAIFIGSVIFHILNKNELKAIMGHELGHFYRYQLPIERLRGFFDVFIGIFPAYIWFILGFPNIWIWIILIVSTYFVISLLIAKLSMQFEYTLEYLSDYYSTKRFGKLNMINGLLAISKSSEIMEGLYKLILEKLSNTDSLSHKDYDRIVATIMKRLPTRLQSKKALKDFVDNVFKSEEITKLTQNPGNINKRSKAEFIKESMKAFKSKNNFRILDWDLFDFNKKDYKIDEVEYPYLINSLIEHPDEQMFDLFYDNIKNTKKNTHPTIRERILFLEKHFP